MQDVRSWGSSMSVGDEITATDARDGKTYTVAKLADGNIWMTQNLVHDIGDIDGGTYTSVDTDIPANWTPNYATIASGTTSWDGAVYAPNSYDPGNLCWNGTLVSSSSQSFANTVSCTQSGSHYHLDNYYNWTAAVAMNDSSGYASALMNANQSICPAGWQLPLSGATDNVPDSSNKTFQYLVSTAGFTGGASGNVHSSPAYFAYSGSWSGYDGVWNTIQTDVGYFGGFWSSVSDNMPYSWALGLFMSTDNLDTYSNLGRGGGKSVRCLVR